MINKDLITLISVGLLLFGLYLTTYGIFQKHQGTQNARAKISKETIQFVITLLLISFLAGLVGLFVNAYVSPIYGVGVGLVCTLLVSFAVGYVVKKGISIFGVR